MRPHGTRLLYLPKFLKVIKNSAGVNYFLNNSMRFSEHATGPIHTTGYNLRGLEPASVYEVSVVSKNRFGWSDSSRIVRFATIGESK